MLVLKYFSFFAYYPTLVEIHTFLQAKISKNELNIELDYMVKLKLIELYARYTPPQYSMGGIKNNNETMKQWNNLHKRRQISQSKLNSFRFKLYIKLLSIFPQIKLVGLSGSISMMSAGEDDDIDLFIITAKNRLFTGRLISLLLAQILGLRRNREAQIFIFSTATPQRGPWRLSQKQKSALPPNNETMKQLNNHFRDKVCLNLFFDESNLKVPLFKQTEFVGHEVLQMKPIVVKGDVYERFLKENEWVYELFPNVKSQLEVIPAKAGIQAKITIFSISDKIEQLLKKFQLRLINKHKTTEIITSTQLWFHPDDFEKKIKHNLN
ncbi:MAG: hypothetical protein UR56_C0025G0004 [Candidatus Roizmanbacteria bacterium GW2011_GWC2_34_23]|uniref:Polymerase nucleotidyl transferase domain-containing protein n=1 Tax=Candidatus Roizmanbacteria bacterium GW2011_GWC2_34_23 TaxID=1618484 RepID=A0A0G0ATB0_9BACT|nr:MAG: hypothetical protein UR56_C0025G0004 [Candidatus Roizmanbacteria bacterium GW2011_GWC2_34_23]